MFTTAHDALFTQCGLAMGERVCVHGAAGGVGVAGVQLAVAAGCSVVATVRNEALRAAVAALRRRRSVDPDGFGDHGPFDVMLELVGGPNLAEDVQSLATGGRIAIIGVGGGAEGRAEPARPHGQAGPHPRLDPPGPLAWRTRRPRPGPSRSTCCRCSPPGAVTVPVEATFPMAEAAAAYERFAAGGKLGKIVLVS